MRAARASGLCVLHSTRGACVKTFLVITPSCAWRGGAFGVKVRFARVDAPGVAMKNILLSCLVLAALALCCPASPSFAAESAPASPELEAQIRQILRDHPEIVLDALRANSETVLDIVQQGSDQRRDAALQRQWQDDAKTPKKVAVAGRPARGPENAPITLVAFSDFTCTYCQQAAVTVENLLRRYPEQIRFVFKQTPHNDAGRVASRWFLAALRQDELKAWRMYALLFDRQQQYLADPAATLRAVAADAKLDPIRLDADLKAQEKNMDALIDGDIADAKALGFSGTPYFLVNNLIIRGSLPLENFVDAVEFAKKAGK